jgi:hypothetical protein
MVCRNVQINLLKRENIVIEVTYKYKGNKGNFELSLADFSSYYDQESELVKGADSNVLGELILEQSAQHVAPEETLSLNSSDNEEVARNFGFEQIVYKYINLGRVYSII